MWKIEIRIEWEGQFLKWEPGHGWKLNVLEIIERQNVEKGDWFELSWNMEVSRLL